MKKIIKGYAGIVSKKNGDTIDIVCEEVSNKDIFAIYPKKKDCLYQSICKVEIIIDVLA